MRYFYDEEFIEDGRTVDLLSLAVVAEDGREFFAVSTECAVDRAGPWVRAHVLPHLPDRGDPAWRSRAAIRDDVLAFLTADGTDPALWAWFGAYDHVGLCQLWGAMPDLPRALPRFTLDVRQLWHHLGEPPMPDQLGPEHDALADARHVKVRFDALHERAYSLGLRL